MFRLAEIVRFHRREAGLSQVELAALASVSRKVVQQIESGRDAAAWRNVLSVLRALNIDLEPAGPLVGRWKESSHRGKGTPGSAP